MQLWIEQWEEGQIQKWHLVKHIEPKDRIEQLKAMIWALDTKLAVGRQKLVFNRTELRDNDCTCSHYGLGDLDVIELYVESQKKRKRENT